MTDSVKLCAFSDWRMPGVSVPWIGALQARGGAGSRVAARPPRAVAPPPTADVAGPARLGEEVEDVGAAEEAHHLAASNDRHAADALADQESRRLVDARLLGDRDDAGAHDVARRLAAFGEDVGLGHDADDVAFVGYDRGAGDALRSQRAGDLLHRRVFAER